MKNILMLTMVSIIAVSAKSQTIAPALSGQYCPLQNITFTVRLPLVEPGTPVTITTDAGFVPGGGVTVNPYNIADSSNAITKFNFNGTFGDNNTKQSFKVTSTRKGATVQSTDEFVFRYIKSLKNAAPFPSIAFSPCKVLNLGIGSVTIPRCQIQNVTLNFNNVPFSTPTEPNDFCWGSIQQYEYQLPVGWSIGGTVSNGSNWIVDDSNVVITSDLGNGDLSKIRVRPSNANCGTGLQNNQLVAEVSISRPAPSFTISNPQLVLCNTSANYTLTGMPAGSTVLWTISNSSLASLTNPTSQTVTVTPTGTSGNATLTATVTHCSFSYTTNISVKFGAYTTSELQFQPNYAPPFGTSYPPPYCWGATVYFRFSDPSIQSLATGFQWFYSSNWTYVSGQGTAILCLRANPTSFPSSGSVGVRVSNSCGSSNVMTPINYAFRGNCIASIIVITPNPTTSDFVTVEHIADPINKFASQGMQQIEMVDKMGGIRFRKKLSKGVSKTTISVSSLPNDVYTIRVFDGNQWITRKLSLQR